jgi:hypothetical protein
MDLIIILSILVGLIVSALLVGVVLVARRKRREKETDYKVFFTSGNALLPMGILFLALDSLRPMGIIFLCLGASYLAIGLANKDKWAKDKKSSKET